ncbi:unnamed protein product (macronuclear) [Paramecium tetraurelia]|uniref:Uncharacterized protein n=1 Tax=Paramecium tetraurelia TaxID=5888 RepID=A0BM87_PARTE|nr:uncharacterized protein GSPATT00030289001 [Paramecium tetraurelia]CAK59654.1 unnamed protein product [Paramecium tetraurelia]
MFNFCQSNLPYNQINIHVRDMIDGTVLFATTLLHVLRCYVTQLQR